MRKRLYEILEIAEEGDRLSSAYDTFMMVVIIVSLVPLAFKQTCLAFQITDRVAVTIFIADYILRWLTADLKLGRQGAGAFLRYPFTFLAIIDILSILPSLVVLSTGFKALRVLRLVRTLMMLRLFRVVRHSKNIQMIQNVLRRSKGGLLTVSSLAVAYILVSALIILNVEPDSFETYFDAVYWATVSLTTVGYGDIYPVTTVGRFVTMLSSFVGTAIVALPSGIITAGYLREVESPENRDQTP